MAVAWPCTRRPRQNDEHGRTAAIPNAIGRAPAAAQLIITVRMEVRSAPRTAALERDGQIR